MQKGSVAQYFYINKYIIDLKNYSAKIIFQNIYFLKVLNFIFVLLYVCVCVLVRSEIFGITLVLLFNCSEITFTKVTLHGTCNCRSVKI